MASSKTIILIRHGQAESNLLGGQLWLRDPSLTPLGRQQCEQLVEALAGLDVDHILVSPLLRALQTCDIVNTRNCSVTVMPELQETSANPSDTPDPDNQLVYDKYAWSVDGSSWYSKTDLYAADYQRLVERAGIVRTKIAGLTGTIVVVTHGAFIRILLGKTPNMAESKMPGYYYNNCEARRYNSEWSRDEVIHPGKTSLL